jgi:trehalose synthase-fused probable maltokinase
MLDQPSSTLDRAAVATALQLLDLEALARARWFGAKGRTIETIALDEAFVLDEGVPHVVAIASLTLDDRTTERYSIALTGPHLREALPGDGAWRCLVLAMAEGRTIPALPSPAAQAGAAGSAQAGAGGSEGVPGPVTAALVCRPGVAMPPEAELGTERDLGADQSNTGVVIGEGLLLKAYRRLQPGLNPDLEMTAFLSEEAGFTAVPPLAGFVELIESAGGGTATTLAMAQQYIADGSDAFESVAEALVGWIQAPGTVSIEVATDIAADLGALTAGLHAALADGRGLPDMTPRDATRDELRGWATTAHANLERALEVAPDDAGTTVRDLAPAIAEALTVLDALPTTPVLQRIHGDYHLGQVLIAPDGFRIVDFEGEPLSTPAERRALRHPMRDVASMLRSLDHVGRSAARRVVARADAAPDEGAHVGLDVDAWIERARARFLEAYRDGLREARVWIDVDADLLRAFEVDKELYEFAYAATYLPTWLYAPTEGLRALFPDR